MKHLALISAALLLAATAAFAEVQVVFEHNDNDTATAQFKFKRVPAPSKTDAATQARFSLAAGQEDGNGGGPEKLHDGRLPTEADEPGENFFFDAGTEGGRIAVDLGKVLDLRQINTYSWHTDNRGPQVYTLYASDGKADGFKPEPGNGVEPEKCGWKSLAKVDTRPKDGQFGGQYGVSISDSTGSLGQYRYLLFDCVRTEADDTFGNTFYSEIDVIPAGAPATAEATAAPAEDTRHTFEADGGKYHITIDTSRAPDLTHWATNELAPVVEEWYPKLIQLLPSDGFTAPTSVSITLQPVRGGTPAYTSGNRITCNSDWFSRNLEGEAKGAVVHEMVHVIQHYGRSRSDPDALRPPGWLVEGIPDYLRWFKYEPQSHGADVAWLRKRRNIKLNYDGMYRISANFLNWASEKYGQDLVPKVNAALRVGQYKEALWKQLTGHTIEELNEAWKKDIETQLAQPAPASPPHTTTSALPQHQNPLAYAGRARTPLRAAADTRVVRTWSQGAAAQDHRSVDPT